MEPCLLRLDAPHHYAACDYMGTTCTAILTCLHYPVGILRTFSFSTATAFPVATDPAAYTIVIRFIFRFILDSTVLVHFLACSFSLLPRFSLLHRFVLCVHFWNFCSATCWVDGHIPSAVTVVFHFLFSFRSARRFTYSRPLCSLPFILCHPLSPVSRHFFTCNFTCKFVILPLFPTSTTTSHHRILLGFCRFTTPTFLHLLPGIPPFLYYLCMLMHFLEFSYRYL